MAGRQLCSLWQEKDKRIMHTKRILTRIVMGNYGRLPTVGVKWRLPGNVLGQHGVEAVEKVSPAHLQGGQDQQ